MRPLASTTGRRPAKPTRLRASLSETHVRPDEVVERWVENPYWPYFCGFDFFQHRLPIDSSTMTRWRRRVDPEGMRFCRRRSVLRLTREQSRTAVSSGLRWPKAIAYPTDSRLYLKALQALVRQAKRHGIVLRRSHTRVARRAALMVTPMPDSSGACAASSGNSRPIWAGFSAILSVRLPGTSRPGSRNCWAWRLLVQQPGDKNKLDTRINLA